MNSLQIDNRIITTPIIDIVKAIRKNCNKLAVIKSNGDDLQVTCPNPSHKGGHESKPSGGIYVGKSTEDLKYGFYHCFTCDAKGPFEYFVALCFECSIDNAKKWLIDNFADDEIDYQIDLPEIELTKPKKEYIDESILKTFQDFHPYMNTRKLNKHICEVFEVKYDPKTKCLVFPVRDEKGKLFMFTRRSVEEKKFIIDKDKEKPLYLMYYMLQKNIDKYMITEGQIDALTACGFGFPCVATMGAISDKQIETINKSGVRVLYTMFDCDKAGKDFTNKLIRQIRKDILVINVPIIIGNKKDINDLTQDEFYKCVEFAENNCIL